MEITKQIRQGLPTLGYNPYRQIHLHSTANPNSTSQNEADYMNRKDINSGYYTHVVGNGRAIQTAPTGKGAYDVGGGWNYETYAALELIESHATRAEFERDYKLWVELARQLANEAKIPKTLDTNDLEGIKTHMYCTYNQPENESDHIDPYPYLNKWGITAGQLEKDLVNGFSDTPNNNQNTNINKPKQQEEITMVCTYQVEGGKTLYYFDGQVIKALTHPDQAVALREIYKRNNGKDMPHITYSRKAPFNKRLEEVTKLKALK
ncbi:N-acetylmuramoyl-L-alanine amidase [Candidatus Enterococcus ikei]|uniref:N-acetylmuramoyl-L-alanine amidase n=1 Tax=Candidatus Enterococcus ikei TaxID=2815326 RepID=A0ABS3GVX8_9ENTE|nr:N-acetylmuramoyl-L-alanine amidase [Enterococcus sp. DIV0869a]MBO0438980.1 N-acetylmuramoyl-L-alanine amidase [Enterococcus sp. DIV0869a]